MSEDQQPEYYKVIQSCSESFFDRLNELIADGWEPLGPYFYKENGVDGYAGSSFYRIHLWRRPKPMEKK